MNSARALRHCACVSTSCRLARIDRGELEAALKHAKRAAELSTRNPRVQFQLGNVFASMGNFRDAVIQFEHTLRLDPDYPQGQEHLQQARQALSSVR